MASRIKQKFVEAFVSLIEKHPVSKITVAQIVSESGVSRRSFYNSFIDIYDFMFWIHTDKIQIIEDRFWNNRDFYTAFYEYFSFMKENSRFYKEVFKTEGQNSFLSALTSEFIKYGRMFIGKDLTEELDFSLNLFWVGATDRISEWIKKGTPQTPEEITRLLYNSMPCQIQKYYDFGNQQ
ncbi:MAG: hypothetical protein E7235_00450 [Lachnospiraceae bacterium]|nr:hypothetical protein [Lachnospiraceae bacterium]